MRFIQLGAIIGLCASFTAASVLPPPSGPVVKTPVGSFPDSQVHHVPKGAHVNLTENFVRIVKDGQILHETTRSYESSAWHHPGNSSEPQIASGWLAYAYWLDSNHLSDPIAVFSADWEVPPLPHTDHNQVLFLFNALEAVNGTAIIQPVLQYGASAAGGGNYWSVGNWYIDNVSAYWTDLVKVNPGQSLRGVIGYENSNDTYYSYFSDVPGEYGLEIVNSVELPWASVAFEAYGVVEFTDFPVGFTTFSNISIESVSSFSPSVNWTAVSDMVDGIVATVIDNGPTGAEINITYTPQ